MLRKIRITAAAVCCMLITLLFLDFTGTLHAWFGFLAKIQFLPALLALNFGVVAALIVLTLLFGRVYCSVICPLGVMQDAVSWIAGKRTKNRFRYSPALSWLRYGVLALFIAAAVAGIGSFVALLAPYSAYGRIVSNLIAPLYLWGNNLLAYLAERAGSYAFYRADVWMKGIATLAVAAGTFIILAVVAWHNGRTYCNTICPVGTVLGLFSRFSLLAPVIDTCKCNGCGLCARNCKASCIDPKAHRIDLSRCVACMDCIGKCRQQAIHYRLRTGNAPFRAHPVEPPQQPAKKQIQAETDTTSSPIPPETGRTRDATVQTQSRPASQDAQVREGLSSNETSAPGISRRNFLSLTAMLTAGSFVTGAGDEGRRRSGCYRGEKNSEPHHTARSRRGPRPVAHGAALYGLPALRGGLPERGPAPFIGAGDPDAARNVLRTRILPPRMHQMRGSMSRRSNP